MTTPTHDIDEHARFEARLTHLRLELALVMQELRASSGLTQKDLAERLGVNQPAIAKLERAGDHKIEKVLRYLAEFDADLLVAVKQGEDVVQVSDDAEHLLVALPRKVDAWAAEHDKDIEEFVVEAVRDAHESGQHYKYESSEHVISFKPQYGQYAVMTEGDSVADSAAVA